MKEKRVSFGQGKGSITHNNRKFIADNVDVFRTHENITFVQRSIEDAYEQLFAESTERYNARQKRNDRKIHGSYYEHLFGVKLCNNVRTAADKRKSFYEDVVQIGRMEDSGYGTEDFQLVAECLKEYMNGFQKRNPNFYVFNAVLHMDEATPHLHIDYIPIGHYKRGQDTQNGIAQALKEMGYGEGKQAIARWRSAKVEVLDQICREHNIEISGPQKSRGYSYIVQEYGEHKDKIRELETEKKQAETERDEVRAELDRAAKKKVKLDEIEGIEVKESMFGKKVTLAKEDYNNLSDTAKKYVAIVKFTKKPKVEHDTAVQERDKLKTQLSAVSSKLVAYKKKKDEKRHFTHDKINSDSQRIKREEQLSRELQKARAFISACGLSDDFARYKFTKTKSSELE